MAGKAAPARKGAQQLISRDHVAIVRLAGTQQGFEMIGCVNVVGVEQGDPIAAGRAKDESGCGAAQ